MGAKLSRLLPGLALAGVACFLAGSPLGAEDKPARPPSTADWYQDPDCRLVFFATLEGLYGDGVPTEVVDLVLGKGVKHDFVFQCELCHSVYEAFALYQRRPAFNGGTVDTFREGKVDPKIVEALRSPQASVRVYAMGSLVQPWIQRKLVTAAMGDEEKEQLIRRLSVLVTKGKERIAELRKSDPDYGPDWRFYGSCQACEAIQKVADSMGGGKK